MAETNRDQLDIPAFLLIPQEERRAAWARWDALNPNLKPKGTTPMSNNPTPKADALRAMREANASGKTSQRPSRAALKAATAAVKPSKPTAPANPPAAAIAAPAATQSPETPAQTTQETAMTTKSAPKAKSPAKPKAKKSARRSKAKVSPKAARSPARAAKPAAGGVRPGSKLEIIVGLLKRPQGCTTKDVLAATNWPAVSLPQQAKAAGLELKKEKVDGVTVYRAG